MIGGALLAGLTVMRELGRDRYAPAVFVEHHHAPGPHVYFKRRCGFTTGSCIKSI